MDYYSDKLKQATLNLAASSTQLALDIRNLPMTASPDHRNAIMSKFERQHYARKSKIKQDYGVPVLESTDLEEKTFPLLELPPEIQDLVWEFTLPGPRIVPILRKEKFYGLTSPCAPPIALHVCRASRDVALRSGYELAFCTTKHPTPIYFNFAIDTAYIDHPGLFCDLVGHGEAHFSSLDSASRIKRLALGLNVTLDWTGANYWTTPRLEKYASLETLYIATYLCDEWLNYGEIKPAKINNVLIPHLGFQAIRWRQAIKSWQEEAAEVTNDEEMPGRKLSIDNVEVLIITNTTLRPWMCRRVLNQWDKAMAKHLKTRKPEYILDPTQVTAAAKSKLAVFDSVANACDTAYAEKAYAKHGYGHTSLWESLIRGRLRTYAVRYW